MEANLNNYSITTDPRALDIDFIFENLRSSPWLRGVPRELVIRSIMNSFCFGIFKDKKQVGFASVVTDRSHFAYIQDVFIEHSLQGLGLGSLLINFIKDHPELSSVRRFILSSSDAGDFYKKLGFKTLQSPGNWLEMVRNREWFITKDGWDN